MELSERKEMILSAVIERYIAAGEPVGSKFIAAVLPVPVSSATVRNDMAVLSDMGYLEQPYTSAGRIPSDRGYRYYIDNLLKNFTPSDADMFRVVSSIDHSEGDSVVLLSQICEILSAITGCASVAITPFSDNPVISSTQVVPLSRRSAMVVVTTTLGITKGRIARLDCELDYPLMQLFYNVTAANFIGVDCSKFNVAKLQSLAAGLGDKALDIIPLILSLFEAVLEASGAGIVVKGQSGLLNSPELASSAVDIIDLLKNRSKAAVLMNMDLTSPVQVKIGTENEFGCMRNASVVKAPYKVGTNGGGTIGVIGPTRMDYSRVMPLVKYISEITGSKLSEVIDS